MCVASLLLLLVLLLSGCSSLGVLLRSNVEGVPVWVYEPQVGRDQMAFVGKGVSNQEGRSRLVAIESILAQVSDYIGEDIATPLTREMIASGRIELYGLRITQEATTKDKLETTTYLLAVGDRDRLEEARTSALLLLQQQQQQVAALRSEAEAAFRANRDIEAAEKHLQAASIAFTMEKGRGMVQYADHVEQAVKIVSRLNLVMTRPDPAIPAVTLLVRRGSGTLAPRVQGATLRSSFHALDGMGQPYVDEERFSTDSNGQVTYIPDNPTIVGKGTIAFMIDMRQALAAFEGISVEAAQRISTMLATKEITMAYERTSARASAGILVAVMEYSLQGELLASNHANEAFLQRYEANGLFMISAMAHADADDEDFLIAVKAAYPAQRYLVMGKVGVAHTAVAAGVPTVTVSGEMRLIDLRTNQDVYESGQFMAVGRGDSTEAAIQQAFKNYGTVGSGMMARELYR